MEDSPRRALLKKLLGSAGIRTLRTSSEGFTCRCPFHDGAQGFHRSKSPSFSVNAETGQFHCFSGVCGRSGTVRQLLTDLLGFSYSEARKFMEEEGFSSESLGGGKPRSAPMMGLDPSILGVYHRCSTYMLKRGFDRDTLRVWDVGYDRDRKAVTIPVWTVDHKFVGITRRTVLPNVEPRYIHTFEGGARKQVLYGENMVGDVTRKTPLVVVEAQMSVLWLYQWGFPNAVATMGSAISKEQIERISRYRHVIMALDGDLAGRVATQRALHGWGKVFRGVDERTLGLVQRMDVGAVRVIPGWGDFQDKDDPSKIAKDPQEVAPERLCDLLDTAISWEVWNSHTGGRLSC